MGAGQVEDDLAEEYQTHRDSNLEIYWPVSTCLPDRLNYCNELDITTVVISAID